MAGYYVALENCEGSSVQEGCVLVRTPLVSVIMPVHNAEKYIQESVNSVLQQTYKNIELLVVNDCSTDRTREILDILLYRDQRIVLISNTQNIGCADSRNVALEKASGEYIAFIDSDDIWECSKIEKQIQCILKMNVDMVYTAYEMIDGNNTHIKFRNIKINADMEDLLKENFIIFSSTLFRKKSIVHLRFETKYFHEDYVFLLKCLQKKIKFIGLNECLIKYRVHKNGRSFNKINAARYRWEVYREVLELTTINALKYFMFYFFYGIRKYI